MAFAFPADWLPIVRAPQGAALGLMHAPVAVRGKNVEAHEESDVLSRPRGAAPKGESRSMLRALSGALLTFSSSHAEPSASSGLPFARSSERFGLLTRAAARFDRSGTIASATLQRPARVREPDDMRGSHLKTAKEAPDARPIAMADNDAQALSFDAVVAEHGPYVWRVLRRLGVRTSDIEDVWQETFIVVHRKLGGFEGRAQLRTWLSAIAVRVASDYRSRAYRRREQATDELPETGAAASQQEGLLDQERRALLDRLMAELKPEQRDVVVLYEFAELPMQEVAEALGCPLQTAYSRLHAGRKALEQAARREAAKKGSR